MMGLDNLLDRIVTIDTMWFHFPSISDVNITWTPSSGPGGIFTPRVLV